MPQIHIKIPQIMKVTRTFRAITVLTKGRKSLTVKDRKDFKRHHQKALWSKRLYPKVELNVKVVWFNYTLKRKKNIHVHWTYFFYLRIGANAFHMGHFDLLKTCTPTMSNREMNIVPNYIFKPILSKLLSPKRWLNFMLKKEDTF